MTASQTPEAALKALDFARFEVESLICKSDDTHDIYPATGPIVDAIDIAVAYIRAPVSGEAVATTVRSYSMPRTLPMPEYKFQNPPHGCASSFAAHPKPAGEGVEALREKVARAICEAILQQDMGEKVDLGPDLTIAYLDQGAVDFGQVADAILSTLSGGLGSRPAAQAVPTERTSP